MEKTMKFEYTREQKALKKTLLGTTAAFSLVFVVLGVIVFGGGELVTAYFSNLNDSVTGMIFAQILSILGDVFTFVCLVLMYCSLGAHQMSFGTSKSKRAVLFSVLSPIASTLTSFLVFYFLVLAGWHDYTLKMFFEYVPVFLYEAGFSVIVEELITIAVFVGFYLAGSMKDIYSEDAGYARMIKILFYVLIIIKVLSLGFDIALYDGGYASINNLVSGIIFPVLYEVLEIVSGYFALKLFVKYISKKASELGIEFKRVK